ncbi:MAG TPA: hypothetical protein VGN52_15105 [Burkholderiales bacterium]|jgi:photosystem II stability/assembly factor-like uncharacterized protein
MSTPQIHVYAGTAGHSAWFSEDGGKSFVHPNSHSGMYLEARVWTFAMHPEQPGVLYAGTDMGLFRWDEAPARWTALPSPMQDVWALAIDPENPDVLLAGTRPANFYRSADAGRTWEKMSAPGIRDFSEINMGPTRVTQIIFDPLDHSQVWASVEIGGIFHSSDGGRNWTAKENGLVSSDVHGICVIPRPDGSRLLYATTNRGLHQSEDAGEHWQFRPLDSPWQYTRGIVARTDDPAIIFLTNGNGPPGNDGRLWRSRDYGATFEDVRLPAPLNSTPWIVAVNPADPKRLYTCTNLGQLFVSTDGGDTWVRLSHEFGELRALCWRPLPSDTRQADHSVTRAVVKAAA